MDKDCVFVRPTDVFAPHAHSKPEILIDPTVTNHCRWDMTDDEFIRYHSSPESLSSTNTESLLPPIEEHSRIRGGEEERQEKKDEEAPPCNVTAHDYHLNSPQLDTPIQSVVHPDGWQDSLLKTLVYDYAASAYGFCPSLQPHPMAGAVSVAMQNPAFLHLALARAAEYRFSWTRLSTVEERRDLEVVMVHHKDEALRMIKHLSSQAPTEGSAEELIPVVSLLVLLARSGGDGESELMHARTVRQLFQFIGGPLRLRSAELSYCLGHWESSYGSTAHSLVWDRSDLTHLLGDVNQFFHQLWVTQKGRVPDRRSLGLDATVTSIAHTREVPLQEVVLTPDSELYRCLTRHPPNASSPTPDDQSEMHFQLTSFLFLSIICLDYDTDPQALRSYIDGVNTTVAGYNLQGFSCNNVVWLIQVHEDSDMQRKRIWTAAGWVWVLRHVNYNVQTMVRDWLISILTGRHVKRALKLDPFAFSYAN